MTDVLLDTNVLCYASDPRDRFKQTRARYVIDRLGEAGTAVVAPQVVGEFARSTTRPGRGWLRPADARRWIVDMLAVIGLLDWDVTISLRALEGMERFAWTYWDAQIWATAVVHGVRLVLSEDFSDGLVVGGVTFRDPFGPDFDLDSAIMSANA
jgi:predicted nucleic acid-binding protein